MTAAPRPTLPTRTDTVVTVVFVGIAAVTAGYLWTRPTVIYGPSAERMLRGLVEERGVTPTRVDCDRATPVTASGARLECTVTLADEVTHFELTYGRDGRIHGAPIASRRLPTSNAP